MIVGYLSLFTTQTVCILHAEFSHLAMSVHFLHYTMHMSLLISFPCPKGHIGWDLGPISKAS